MYDYLGEAVYENNAQQKLYTKEYTNASQIHSVHTAVLSNITVCHNH
jgi:23S rRNA maturation mini-RNase III